MKNAFIIILLAVLGLLFFFNRSGSEPVTASQTVDDNEQRHIAQLSHVCHVSWQQYDWTIGEQGSLARENNAFSEGIKRICQARAELFFEGYELSPFIAPDAQPTILPIVFIPSVEELKSVMRQNLPALRII